MKQCENAVKANKRKLHRNLLLPSDFELQTLMGCMTIIKDVSLTVG